MYEIALTGLEFFSYHGVYEEEKKSGNKFLIDIKVGILTEVLDNNNDHLENVIDYVRLYSIAEEVMRAPVNLLETLALKIITPIVTLSGKIEYVEVKVAKLNPPIGAKCKESSVTIRKYNYQIG